MSYPSSNFKRRGLELKMASKLLDPSFYLHISFTVCMRELLHFCIWQGRLRQSLLLHLIYRNIINSQVNWAKNGVNKRKRQAPRNWSTAEAVITFKTWHHFRKTLKMLWLCPSSKLSIAFYALYFACFYPVSLGIHANTLYLIWVFHNYAHIHEIPQTLLSLNTFSKSCKILLPDSILSNGLIWKTTGTQFRPSWQQARETSNSQFYFIEDPLRSPSERTLSAW